LKIVMFFKEKIMLKENKIIKITLGAGIAAVLSAIGIWYMTKNDNSEEKLTSAE